MPFRIIRDDITGVNADAIVTIAAQQPRYSSTDEAIYKAAGTEALLAEREKIGSIAPGEAAATPAFRLAARYIIYTVGPAPGDDKHGEYEILRSCYRKSLLLAEQLGCSSIAFPLITAGTDDFPQERTTEAALAAIREHLEQSDLNVTLVVSECSPYWLVAGLTEQVAEYIDENYAAGQFTSEYERSADRSLQSSRQPRRMQSATRSNVYETEYIPEETVESARHFLPQKKASLEDVVNNLGESFQARLLRMIDERGMTDAEVYKRANLDRKLFSKIRCSEPYIPKKKTIVALAIALRLNMDDTRDLLVSAGLLLTNNSKQDLIVSFCIENGIYDIYEVNALLFEFQQPLLA